MDNLFAVISLFGAVQGLFFTFILMSFNKYKYAANNYLALLLLTLTLTLIYSFLHHSKFILSMPELFGVSPFLPLLYGPFLFLYIKKYIDEYSQEKWYMLLHFLPILVFILMKPYYLFLNPEHKKIYLMNLFADQFIYSFDLLAFSRISLLIIYISFTILIISKQKSSIALEQMIWLKKIVTGSIIIWLVYFIFNFYNLNLLNQILPLLISASFFFILYQAIKYPQTFRKITMKNLTQKYESSGLTEERKQEGREKLVAAMEVNHLYSKIDLNIQSLAKEIGFPAKHLSQIINNEFKQNFIDFINSYRVAAAKKKLLDKNKEHLKIMAIANEVGFNSKSTFNSVFKKNTGITPSKFKENHLI